MQVGFADLDLSGTVRLRDVFLKKDLGEFTAQYEVTVPAHGTRIYVAEADTRLERTHFEAETAFISDYQEIKNNQAEKTGIYEASDICSAGYKAGWLGFSEQNDLQWRDVYSFDGGEYDLTIGFISGENRSITVTVNGEKVKTVSCNSGGWGTVGKKKVSIHLQKGRNTVRLSNPSNWMPDIDYIDLKLTASDAIHDALYTPKRPAKAYDLSGRPATSASALHIKDGMKYIQK